MTPKFEIGQDFCVMQTQHNNTTAKFHHPTFNRSEVIVLTNKQTNKQTLLKTPPCSSMLRFLVKICCSKLRLQSKALSQTWYK